MADPWWIEDDGARRTQLHDAAAAGDLERVKQLVAEGHPLDLVDPEYNATPLGWAEFFGQPEVAEYLRGL